MIKNITDFNHIRDLYGNSYNGKIEVVKTFRGGKKGFAETESGFRIYFYGKDELQLNHLYEVEGTFVRIRKNTNPGAFNLNFFAFQNQVYSGLIIRRSRFSGEKKTLSKKFRTYLENLSSDQSVWFKSMLFASILGDKIYMEQEQLKLFKKSGLSHFFALSGLHVGLILFILFAFIKQFIRSYPVRILVIVIFFLFYLTLVGIKSPIFRASLMSILFLLALYYEKHYSVYHVLWITGIFNILFFPHDSFNLSFYLSYSVFFSIIYFAEKSDRILENYPVNSYLKPVFRYIFLVMSPILGSFVLVLIFFSEFPLSSIPNNIFVLPVLLLIFYGMILSVILFQFFPVLSNTINDFIDFLLVKVIDLISFFNNIPVIENTEGNLIVILSFLVFLLILNTAYRKKRYSLGIMLGFILVLFFIRTYINKYWLHIRVFDLGQAQAILASYQQLDILFDAGKDLKYRLSKKNDLKTYLDKLKINYIDYLFLSHRDFDHYGNHKGLNIANRLSNEADSSSFKVANMIYELNDLLILNDIVKGRELNKNDASLVSKLIFGKTSILFTGDIGYKREKMLLEYFPLKSDMIIVPHHGSHHSSSKIFLQAVNAEKAIVSVGLRNRYNHPSGKALSRYNCKIYRTDQKSYLHFISNGDKIYYLNRFVSFLLFE